MNLRRPTARAGRSSRLDAARATTLLGTLGLLAGFSSLAGPVHAGATNEQPSCDDGGATAPCQEPVVLSISCGASSAEATETTYGRALIVRVDGHQLFSIHDLRLINLAHGIATEACRSVIDDDVFARHPEIVSPPCGGRSIARSRACVV
jgi:hypothetical protein